MAKSIYSDIDLNGNEIIDVDKINQKSIGDIDKFAVQLLSNAFDGPQFLSLSKNSTTTIYVQSSKSKTVKASLYNLLDTQLTSSIKVGTPISPTFLLDSNDHLIPIDITTGNELEKVLYLNIEYIEYIDPYNSHEYVDLGLPSGTKWATCNVGASKPIDTGLYFQWGDVQGYTFDQVGKDEGKKAFTWADYKWNPSGDGETITKYANSGDTLDLEDDAAHVHMGGDWHMPSKAQCEELINNTSATMGYFDPDNYGILFESKNGLHELIFIPLAGAAYDGSVLYSGDAGGFWCSTSNTGNAYGLSVYRDSSTPIVGAISRVNGPTVRGVIG